MSINLFNFAVGHEEAATLIAVNGATNSYIIEGSPGTSKSSILKTLEGMLGDKYSYIYVDVPMKDMPDIALSMPNHERKTTMPYINEIWYGKDRNKPKVIMLDEISKGLDYVRVMMNRLLLERMVGDYKLPEGSIVFGTTNFQSDGVGDKSNGHTNSRVTRIPMRPPTKEEWEVWAVNNNIHPLVSYWAKQHPMIFGSYKDVEFDERAHRDGLGPFHYIYHPQHNNLCYVCPRTLELASHQVHNMHITGEALLTKALIGTIGVKAALDMSATFSTLQDMPDPKDVEQRPESARVPSNGAAQMILVYKSVQHIKPDTFQAWFDYMQRLPLEISTIWLMTLLLSKELKPVVCQNRSVVKVALANSWVL